MLVKGDVKCLHCGFISGQWVGVKGAPVTFRGIDRAKWPDGADHATLARCARCEGPVLLEEIDPVVSSHRLRRIQHLRQQIAAFDARRRTAA